MGFFWIAAVALLVWYMVKHQEQRPTWVWIVLGLLALPVVGMFFGGYGMMGGFGGGGMLFPGHMNFGGPGFGGPGPGTWGGGSGMMGGWDGQGIMGSFGGNYWWVAMAVRAVLFIAGITLVYFLAKNYWNPAPAGTPLATLQMRLAKGEITADEFEALKEKLV